MYAYADSLCRDLAQADLYVTLVRLPPGTSLGPALADICAEGTAFIVTVNKIDEEAGGCTLRLRRTLSSAHSEYDTHKQKLWSLALGMIDSLYPERPIMRAAAARQQQQAQQPRYPPSTNSSRYPPPSSSATTTSSSQFHHSPNDSAPPMRSSHPHSSNSQPPPSNGLEGARGDYSSGRPHFPPPPPSGREYPPPPLPLPKQGGSSTTGTTPAPPHLSDADLQHLKSALGRIESQTGSGSGTQHGQNAGSSTSHSGSSSGGGSSGGGSSSYTSQSHQNQSQNFYANPAALLASLSGQQQGGNGNGSQSSPPDLSAILTPEVIASLLQLQGRSNPSSAGNSAGGHQSSEDSVRMLQTSLLTALQQSSSPNQQHSTSQHHMQMAHPSQGQHLSQQPYQSSQSYPQRAPSNGYVPEGPSKPYDPLSAGGSSYDRTSPQNIAQAAKLRYGPSTHTNVDESNSAQNMTMNTKQDVAPQNGNNNVGRDNKDPRGKQPLFWVPGSH